MATRVRVAVIGAGGRMGRAVVKALAETAGARLGAAVGRACSPALGVDAGTLAGLAPLGVVLAAGVPAPDVADVWIDVSTPESSIAHTRAAAEAGACLVIGTTGLVAAAQEAIIAAARRIPLVLAPNTSIGLTVLLSVVADVARALGPGYDLEVLETHHRTKRDAPSGTALRLAEVLAEATGRDLAGTGRYARRGDLGPRTGEEIGIQTLRGGDVIGDHSVHFLGMGERIEVTHRASSRGTFAHGAVRAALWLAAQGRAPGLYDMRDVLGMRDPIARRGSCGE
jgi:4-hydroxy-tetrahydrodipicolinate reductase